jgi:hypothetical protein
MKHNNTQIFLACGILSSVVYIIANIITPVLYEGYNIPSQTVSELSAIDAPTRPFWIALMVPYSLLLMAFGWGIIQMASGSRPLRIAGILLIINAIIGVLWPPMHQREILAAGGGTWSDTLHIVFTFITVPIMISIVGFGASALDKRFRIYSIITVVILMASGVVTGLDGPRISENQSTPSIGIWERISIGIYMLWIVVFATRLLRMYGKKTKLKNSYDLREGLLQI